MLFVRPERLILDLAAIVDPQIRVLALVEALGQGEPEPWIMAIALTADLAHGRTPPAASHLPPGLGVDAARAMEAISQAAGSPRLAYEVRQRLYAAAQDARRPELARLFFDASPPSADPRLVARQTAPERTLEPRGRPLTLGERRALARTHRRDRLALIVKDPHPAVVAVLLGNPHLTEPDLVTIAATRRAVPQALAMIAEHPKWSTRQAIKRALVMNPATPLAAAMRLAATLPSEDLVEVSKLSSLPAALRDHVRELLQRRRQPRSGPTPLS
ncbi:MAG: hypothetical protein IPI49_00620 [Myxococcales bacterium]|nr:hypothetical protein [Myxococcales bacterium]